MTFWRNRPPPPVFSVFSREEEENCILQGVTQGVVVNHYRRFGTTYRYHLVVIPYRRFGTTYQYNLVVIPYGVSGQHIGTILW